MLKKFILRLLGKDKLYKMNKQFRKAAKAAIKKMDKQKGKHEN